MPKSHPPCPPEFRRQMVELVRAGRSPEELTQPAHEPDGAQAVVFGLLMNRDSARRAGQFQILEESVEPPMFRETMAVLDWIDEAPEVTRLLLVDLAMPSLRRLSEQQHRAFYETVRRLVTAGAKLSIFEYALQHVLLRYLRAHFEKKARSPVKCRSLNAIRGPCSVVLSALAHHGGAEGAILAFQKGTHELGRAALDCPMLPSFPGWRSETSEHSSTISPRAHGGRQGRDGC